MYQTLRKFLPDDVINYCVAPYLLPPAEEAKKKRDEINTLLKPSLLVTLERGHGQIKQFFVDYKKYNFEFHDYFAYTKDETNVQSIALIPKKLPEDDYARIFIDQYVIWDDIQDVCQDCENQRAYRCTNFCRSCQLDWERHEIGDLQDEANLRQRRICLDVTPIFRNHRI